MRSASKRLLVPAACFGLLTSCNNLHTSIRQRLSGAKEESALSLSTSFFKNELRQESKHPEPSVEHALSSIIKSESFSTLSSKDRLLVKQILSAVINPQFAKRFDSVFADSNCRKALEQKDLLDGRLIESLHKLSQQPLYSTNLESQRSGLVLVLLELACGLRPLDQGRTNACGSVACLLALSNQAEIARLVQGLSSVQGQVKLASGEILPISKSASTLIGDGEQGIAVRILSDSIQDYANGKILGFSAQQSLNYLGFLAFPGMFSNWIKTAMSDLTGSEYTVLKKDRLSLKSLQQELDKNGFAIVLRTASVADWHWIVVRRIEGEWAYFEDPNGPFYSLPFVEEPRSNSRRSKGQSPKLDPPSSTFRTEIHNSIFGGTFRVKTADLERCMRAAVVPESSRLRQSLCSGA
jgi:hypothetical protein